MERVTQNVGQVGSTGTEQGAEPARRAAAEAPGLQYTRVFSQAGRDPYGEVEWDRRDAVIANERGEAVFEQRGVEVPRFWSQQATNIVVSKYFRGAVGTAEREWSVRQLIGRVVDTIAMWAREQRYFAGDADLAAFSDDLTHLLVHQKGSFNSPVWFNCGIEPHPQLSACFINAVEDTLDSILTLAKTEGMLFKYGSGTGTNLSSLRSSRESLAGGGTASGPVSFMKGYDAFAGVIKSGGKTRRAAKMVILNADHPDLMDFITCKVDEEKKAWALIDAGYDGSFTGTAYGSVFFQNSNNSVRATDDFMRAVIDDGEWQTRAVKDAARVMDTYKARDIMRQIAEATHVCGDPGMQFDTTVNEWHTCPNSDRINASNPCSEYMFLDNSACNLASINLMKFVDARGEFDVEAFKGAVRVFVTAQEIIVGNASYPTTVDRAQQLRLPAPRPRVREPRRAADVARAAVRQRRRPGVRRGDHRRDDRRGLRPVGAPRPRPGRAVRGLREEPRAVPPRHAQAPRRAARHQHHVRAGRPARRGPAGLGRRGGDRRGARLPQRAGDGARAHRHDRLHDGLRHHRHRAGHRAHQVQEARRRRPDEDRQHHGAVGARQARLHRRPRSRPSSTTSTRRRRSRARRTSRRRTCRCSTAPSSRRRATARSTTWATSR